MTIGGALEQLQAEISSSVPDLVIMRMIKYLLKRAIVTIIYDEISAITKCGGVPIGVGVYEEGRFIAVPLVKEANLSSNSVTSHLSNLLNKLSVFTAW